MRKIALVTGASRGLGLSLTKELLSRDFTVLAIMRKERSEILGLKEKYGDRIITLLADITNNDEIQNCKIEALKKVTHIDLLINNVGIWLDCERLRLDDARFDFDMIIEEFSVNAVAPLRIIRAFDELIKKSELKTIVNISSEAGSISMHDWREGEYAYCMSKAALNMASKILEHAYRTDNFKLYAVDPGWMRTDMGGKEASLDPAESAKDIVDLAVSERRDYIFCNRLGEKYSW